MECPNPKCEEGHLVLTRVAMSYLGMAGEVPELYPDDWQEEFIACTECGEMPSYTWDGDKIVLAGGYE